MNPALLHHFHPRAGGDLTVRLQQVPDPAPSLPATPLEDPVSSSQASAPPELPSATSPDAPPTPAALLYTVITQTAIEVQDIRNAPAVSMARYLVEHDRTHLLPTLSVYGERGPNSDALRILYMNAGAFALWEEMGMRPTVVGAQPRPAKTAQLTYGVPFSE